MVRLVSAMLVATMTFLFPLGASSKILHCVSKGIAAYTGSTTYVARSEIPLVNKNTPFN